MSTTKHIFETQADLSGAKAFTNVQKEINKALSEVNRTFDSSNKIIGSSTRIVEKDKEKLLELTVAYRNLNGVIEKNSALYRQTDKGLQVVSGSLKVATQTTADATSKSMGLAGALGSVAQKALLVAPVWMILRAAIQLFVQSIKEAIKFMIDFQFALAQVKIVGDITEKDMKKLSQGIVDLGAKFGGNFDEMSDAMILWAQQGKTVNEILTLMEPTIKASVINQRSMKDTVEDLTAIMKAYNLEASQVMEVEDKITKIQLNHAISAKDLSEGLRRLAPAASQYNLTLDETFGLLTAIQTVTRDTGSVAARGANTILNRLAKPENVQSVQAASGTKLFFDEAGNETNVVTDSFKNQIQILDTLSKKWDELSVTQKNNIINTIAGTHQYVRGAAALINWKEAIDVTKEAMNSQGASQKAFNDLQDTTKMKVEQLNNAWKGLIETQQGWFNSLTGAVVDRLKERITDLTSVIRTVQSFGDDNIPGETEAQYNKRMEAQKKGEEDSVKIKAKGVSELAKLEKVNQQNQKSALAITRDLKSEETSLLEQGVSSIGVKRQLRENLLRDAAKSGLIDDKGGVTDSTLRNKLKKLTDDISKEQNKENKILSLEKEKIILQDMISLGANEVQLQIQKIAFEKQRAIETRNTLEVKKQELELQRLITAEIAASSQELQKATSSNLTSAFLGDQSGGDALKGISKTIRSGLTGSAVEGLTGQFFQMTGLGKTFGTMTTNLENAFVTGSQKAAPILANAIIAGAKGAVPAGAGGKTGGNSGNTGLSGLLGGFNNPGIGGGLAAAGLGALGGLSGGPFNSTGGNIAFGAVQGIATAVNPMLGAAVSLAGGLFSLFKKPKNTIDVKEQERTIQVASKIDVTNKKLDIVNRNLVALRQTFETFILPESAAFATKRNLEDQFSLNARRGIF